MSWADRIAVMDNGRIVQVGTPDEIWHRPAGRAVASLFGQAQHLEGTVEPGGVATAFGRLDRSCEGTSTGDTVDVLVRPNAVALERVAGPSAAHGRVEDIRFLGDRYLVLVGSAGHTLHASIDDRDGISVGDSVTVRLDRSGTFVYATSDG